MALPVSAESTHEDLESRWLAHTYRGGAPQLTVRAVLVGMAIGAVMCLSNLYVFFKTGWSMGVTITAAILSFARSSCSRAAPRASRSPRSRTTRSSPSPRAPAS